MCTLRAFAFVDPMEWNIEHSWQQGNSTPRVEIPEMISSEQRFFRDLTFFSADSENMKNINADQHCFRADQLWFSLNQRCPELKNSALFQRESALNKLWIRDLKHWGFSAEQRWFSAHLFWISSDIHTSIWKYQNVIT